jgi:hypothetical protein
MATKNISWGKGLTARKADNLTAMWAVCLENMRAFTACYRDSFTVLHECETWPLTLMEEQTEGDW